MNGLFLRDGRQIAFHETMQCKGQIGYKRKLFCWAYSWVLWYWVVYFVVGGFRYWKLIFRKHTENCLNMRIQSHVDMYSLVVCSNHVSNQGASFLGWIDANSRINPIGVCSKIKEKRVPPETYKAQSIKVDEDTRLYQILISIMHWRLFIFFVSQQYLSNMFVLKCNPWNHQLHHFCLSFTRWSHPKHHLF